MKNRFIFSLFLLTAPVWAGEGPKVNKGADSDEEKIIYTLGVMVGRNLSGFNLKPVELKHFSKGLKDTVEGKMPPFDTSVYSAKLQEFQKNRQEARAAEERKKSAAYLVMAAKAKNAKVFPSGLIFTEIQAGAGPSPSATDTIKVHYQGAFINNTVFDSSYKRGQPAEFGVSGVIACWTEGVQKMKVGGKAVLVCPASIAYGDQGRPQIPGGATLIFDIELVEIVGKK